MTGIVDWAAGRADTLIVVTADHETGGLIVEANNGVGTFPDVTWTTTGHTDTPVPVYAWGVNASHLEHVTDNTHIYELMVAGMTDTTSCTPNVVSVAEVRGKTGGDALLLLIVGLACIGGWLPMKPRKQMDKRSNLY